MRHPFGGGGPERATMIDHGPGRLGVTWRLLTLWMDFPAMDPGDSWL